MNILVFLQKALTELSIIPHTVQAASHHPLITNIWAQSLGTPCGICGGKSGTVTGLSLNISVFPHYCHSSNAPYSHFIHLPVMLYTCKLTIKSLLNKKPKNKKNMNN